MWWRMPQTFSRQAVNDALSRSSSCTCHAKRYIPSNRQRKHASDGSNPRRKSSAPSEDSASPSSQDLLRELNTGSVGFLRDEDEQDWGLDDVAEHARARQQQRLQRFGGSHSAAAGGGNGGGGGYRHRRDGSSGPSDAVNETHGSPLESGLASIITDDDDSQDRDIGLSVVPSTPRSMDSGGAVRPASGGVLERGALSTMPTTKTTVDMEVSYARRNPEVIEALRLRGFAIRVRQPDGGTDDEWMDDEADGNNTGRPGIRTDFPDFGLSDDDDGLDLLLDSDLALGEDIGEATVVTQSGSRTNWYDGLAAAGFSVRTNAAGEVFLERTVRRKAPAAAAVSAPVAGVPLPAHKTSVHEAAAPTQPQPTPAQPQTLVAPLEPVSGRPAIVSALQRLTSPQQVLDFVELSYSQWAANGYRLADMRTGRPVAAPSPSEAAHGLRALAITARRTGCGGWKCLELAAGRQAQGLAEALRVTPPRLLPEQATQQLSAAYFDTARRFWLESAADPMMIGDPRVSTTRSVGGSLVGGGSNTNAKGAISEKVQVTTSGARNQPSAAMPGMTSSPTAAEGTTTAAAKQDDNDEGLSLKPPSPSSYDPAYDSLIAKYTAISQIQQQQRKDHSPGSSSRGNRPVNGHVVPATAAAVRTENKVLAALPMTELPSVAPTSPAASSAAARNAVTSDAAAAATAAAKQRAAKVECLVSALWAMSSLGGPPYFEAETEAAVTILVRCLASAAAAPPPAAASTGTPSSGLTGWQAGQVLWALGNSRHVTPRLPDLETNILRSGGLSSMQPRDATRVLWGFASLGYKPERLLLTIRPDWSWRERTAVVRSDRDERVASGRSRKHRKGRGKGSEGGGGGGITTGDVRNFTPQQLAGAVWALAVMEQVDTGPFRSAWAQLLCRGAEVPLSEPVLTQIWQANMAIHLESSSNIAASTVAPSGAAVTLSLRRGDRRGGSCSVAAEDLTAAGLAAAVAAVDTASDVAVAVAARSLLLRSRDVFLAATSALRRKVQSGYQRQMANTLTGLRMMHLLEDNSAGYSIDITLPQFRIALEADGPTHSSRTPGGAVLGATAMKRRHLQRMGWHVVNVTYKEWDKLTSESARRAFLQERINEALLSRIQIDDADEGSDVVDADGDVGGGAHGVSGSGDARKARQ